jgi:hypothetical protein
VVFPPNNSLFPPSIRYASDGTFDALYIIGLPNDQDLPSITKALVASGYKLYNLHRADTGKDVRVWARPELKEVGRKREKLNGRGPYIETEPIYEEKLPDLSGIIAGTVTRLPISEARVDDFVVHGEMEGGRVRAGDGRNIPSLFKPKK